MYALEINDLEIKRFCLNRLWREIFRLLKSTHTHLYFKYMTSDSEAASLSKDQRVSGPLAWVGEGGLCDKVQSTCSGDPPPPPPPQTAHLLDKGYSP